MFKIFTQSCLVNLILALLLLSISCGSKAQPSSQAEIETERESWAIVVGAGEYISPSIDVRYADDDAIGFSAKLEAIFGIDHVKLLVSSNATKTGFHDAVFDWLAPEENNDDLILFFLAGHGSSGYFQLNDSILGSYVNDISPSELKNWLDILDSKTIVIIMDFCESGSYGENVSGNGRIVITGCTGHEKWWQEKAYEHGIFSYYLIRAFDDFKSVDANHDLNISVEEIFEYTKLEVTTEFRNYPPPSPQHPHINDYYEGELILFTYSSGG